MLYLFSYEFNIEVLENITKIGDSTMLLEEMVFWTEEETMSNTGCICENFIENVLEYIFSEKVSELDMNELYSKSSQKMEEPYSYSYKYIYCNDETD
ncbi:hypothetical protein Clos_2670 [Alkaliphilus oremlandii OhILAs]|uniref:Uncharacterized protein n=2 Tax=Alkaliphilus oremlandii TaxID=461876 RepID=A8MK69_ALKOO|nr:hypothetical protein Clos_2670 [Alkaliphilus oremlandii OhILAs]